MNIYEISDKSKISVTKLRVLDKLGVLRHDASTTELDGIRDTIRNGNLLNVGQLVYLVEHREGLLELGKYAAKASAQLESIRDAAGQVEPAPRAISAQILDAFEKQPEACEAIIAWAKMIIPRHAVGHSYIAARLLLGVPEASRKHDLPRLHRAFMNCRDLPSFDGWHGKEKGVSRNRIVYHKLALDL